MPSPTPNKCCRSTSVARNSASIDAGSCVCTTTSVNGKAGELTHAADLPGEVDQHHGDTIDHQRHPRTGRITRHQTH